MVVGVVIAPVEYNQFALVRFAELIKRVAFLRTIVVGHPHRDNLSLIFLFFSFPTYFSSFFLSLSLSNDSKSTIAA